MIDHRNVKMSDRLEESTRTIRGKEYIGIVNGNQITAVEVKEILDDGFVAEVVGDPSNMPITYPMIPFASISDKLKEIIEEKLDGIEKDKSNKNNGNVVKGEFN